MIYIKKITVCTNIESQSRAGRGAATMGEGEGKSEYDDDDSDLLIQGVASLMDSTSEALCQVMLLKSSCHAHIRGMRACTHAHIQSQVSTREVTAPHTGLLTPSGLL